MLKSYAVLPVSSLHLADPSTGAEAAQVIPLPRPAPPAPPRLPCVLFAGRHRLDISFLRHAVWFRSGGERFVVPRRSQSWRSRVYIVELVSICRPSSAKAESGSLFFFFFFLKRNCLGPSRGPARRWGGQWDRRGSACVGLSAEPERA